MAVGLRSSPAKAGTRRKMPLLKNWVPAFAGTNGRSDDIFWSRLWHSRVAEQSFELGSHRRGEIVARQRVCDVGGEKADLRSTVEAAADEFEPVERLRLGELDHRVGQLDFVAGAASFRRQDIEDFRLQDVSA